MNVSKKRCIGLISCAKEKADGPRVARELYTSPYFRKMRGYVETMCDDWCILSALHYLVHPDQILAPYEVRLKDMNREEQRRWAETVAGQVKAAFPDVGKIVLEVHGGAEYTLDLVPLLRSLGYEVELPVPSLPIGKRMQWYDRRMQGHGAAGEPDSIERAPRHGMRTTRLEGGPPMQEDFQRELDDIFEGSTRDDKTRIDVEAGDLHRRVGGYPGPNHRMPVCCSVMRRNMGLGDVVIAEPPSGKGASLRIRYKLPR
jgi:hypothetical protein